MAEPTLEEELTSLLPVDDDIEDLTSGEESDDNDNELSLEEIKQELESYKADAEAARQFRADPVKGLHELAAQLGLEVSGKKEPVAAVAEDTPETVKSAVAKALKDSPDLGFLAPILESSLAGVVEGAIKPLREQTERQAAATRQAAVRAAEARMDKEFPNWRTHNSEMEAVGQFIHGALNGGELTHPKYGDIYSMIYKVVTGEGKAVSRAAAQLSRAGQNRTSTGRGTSSKPDIGSKISKAVSTPEKVEIALTQALNDLGV